MVTLTVEIVQRSTGEQIAAYTLTSDPPAGGGTDYAVHHEGSSSGVHESRVYWGKGARRVGTMNTEAHEGETVRAWAFDIDDDRAAVSEVIEFTV